ncbi:MAG: LysM peptidoglycan-binding domain-containing protein, partial [Euzebya sp.]
GAQRTTTRAVDTLLPVGVLSSPPGPPTTVPPADATPPAMQVVPPPVPILGFPQVPGPPDGDLPGVPTPPPTTPQPTGLPPTIAEQQSASEGASHQVAAGENLWVIARATISGDPDRPPTDREVHAYWVRLIAANDFSSGNPDLIHPGEVLRLPPLSPGAADGPGAAP